MKRLLSILVAVALTAFLAGSAMADAFNTRPVPVGGTSLQDTFNSIYVSGPGIDVIADQTPYALFTNEASGGSVATMVIEIAALAGTNRFGIYEAGDPTNKAQIFTGSDAAGASRLVSYLANGDILVNGVKVASGFGGSFGFYVEVWGSAGQYGPGDGNDATLDYTVYSEDSANPSGEAHALIYQGDGATTIQIDPYAAGLFTANEFIIAFEDWLYSYGSDKSFSDMVVIVESITPIPEPATMLLVGTGLVGLAGYGRRKLFKK